MESISFCDYRGFESLSLEFSEKVNLLIGDNASGKTTIIRGVSTALSSFFTGFSDENTRFSGLGQNDFRVIQSNSSQENERPIIIAFKWGGKSGSLELKTVKGRTLQDPLKDIKAWGKEMQTNLFKEGKQTLALPLFTSFSTSDIHKPRKFGTAIFKKYIHKPSFGYFECFQGDGFMKYWTLRLLALREGRSSEIEVEGVINALITALGEEGCGLISNVDIRPIQGKVYYHQLDGRQTDSDNLSDGFTRIVSLVLDLAFRCMILNKGIYGLNACKETTGTVLIDEIDLHLHPSLQSSVIKGIQSAFPQLQFIITSHAPMIMASVPFSKENKIIKLDFYKNKGYEANEAKAYGLDPTKVVQDVLDIIPRPIEVETKLTNLFELIDNKNYDSASRLLTEMGETFGDSLPDLSKAKAMLNFLMSSDDD